MKKKNTYGITTQISMIIILFFISHLVSGQTECSDPSYYTESENNNVNALISSGQLLFYDQTDAHYEIPAGSGVHAFFAAGMLMGGLDQNDVLHASSVTYVANGDSYLCGPLDDNGQLNETSCMEYNYIFQISRATAENHAFYFESVEDGTVDENFPDGYVIPTNILDYPGNVNFIDGVSSKLAPFYDDNENGLYEPTLSDYPLFNGMIGDFECQTCETLSGDMAYFWVNNDLGISNGNTPNPLGVEIHNVMYAYNTSDALNNSLFFQKKIINKSSNSYNDFYVGIFADPDIGGSQDDYGRCDVQRNMGFAYNGDDYDEEISYGGYGDAPPAVGIKLLGTTGDLEFSQMSSALHFNISGDYPSGGGVAGAYNLIQGLWANGSPITYGGNGLNGEIECKYMYPGVSDPLGLGTGGILVDPWSEETDANSPSDTRMIINQGPYSLEPGESICINFATVYAPWNSLLPSSENLINSLELESDFVQDAFDNCFESTITGIDENEVEDVAVVQWNISNSVLNVNPKNNETLTILLIDDIGRLVKFIETNDERSINLSDIASGLYVVNIINQKGTKQSEKIVKL